MNMNAKKKRYEILEEMIVRHKYQVMFMNMLNLTMNGFDFLRQKKSIYSSLW